MKFKIIFIMFLFILCWNLSAEENPREKVAIVDVKLDAEISDTFSAISELYEKKGDLRKSEYFKNIPNEWYGSGFIIKDEKGDYYLITNRHVVEFAESITVSFQNKKDVILSINDFDILYTPDYIDLALLTIKDKSVDLEKFIFSLSSVELEDGQEIWAAGYPGINNTPVWQLSSGIITNSWVKIDEIKTPENSYLIQHSAPVDPGNSGGPLLIKENDETYNVAGINTWKITGRSNTNFSIPVEILPQIIDEASQINSENSVKQRINETVSLFIDYQNGEELDLDNAYLISEELVSEYGYPVYEEIKRTISYNNAEKLEKAFLFDSATRTMQEAIYYKLYYKLKKDNTSWRIKNIFIEENNGSFTGTSVISSEESDIEIKWVYENGAWKIASFPDLEEVVDPLEYFDNTPRQDYDITGFGLYVTIEYPINKYFLESIGKNLGLGFYYDMEIFKPFFFSVGAEIGIFKLYDIIYQDREDIEYKGTCSGVDFSSFFNLGAVFQLETENEIQIVPKITASLGAKMYQSSEFTPYNGTTISDDGTGFASFYSLKGIMEFRKRSGLGLGYGIMAKFSGYNYIDTDSYINDYTYPNYFSVDIGGFLQF